MPLYEIPEKDLRDHCKRAVETLELWLRRLIHESLFRSYGENYLNARRKNDTRVISSKVAKKLNERLSKEPARFATPIDAAYLDDEISLVCNPVLYLEHFAEALSEAFPGGCDEARTFLERLTPVRNALSHANPISVHDAYRVLCYTHDVTHSIKSHYRTINMQDQYNAPTVVRVTDSLGHAIHLSTSNRHPNGSAMIDFSQDDNAFLRCGDTLSIEVEVDPTFDPSTYEIKWLISDVGDPAIQGPKFSMLLAERNVSTRFCAVCQITSDAAWHKLGMHDDQIDIAYRVLPPI